MSPLLVFESGDLCLQQLFTLGDLSLIVGTHSKVTRRKTHTTDEYPSVKT